MVNYEVIELLVYAIVVIAGFKYGFNIWGVVESKKIDSVKETALEKTEIYCNRDIEQSRIEADVMNAPFDDEPKDEHEQIMELVAPFIKKEDSSSPDNLPSSNSSRTKEDEQSAILQQIRDSPSLRNALNDKKFQLQLAAELNKK